MLTLTIVLGLLALGAILLVRTYSYIPVAELKRRARSGDKAYVAIYKAIVYGWGLSLALWLIIGASSAGFAVLTTRLFPDWLAFLAITGFLWLGFGWAAKIRPNTISFKLAGWFAWILAPLARWASPLVSKLENWAGKRHPSTNLFEKADLIELIKRQRKSAHNRMDKSELDIAERALRFGDKLVRGCLTPRSKVRFVYINEAVGPILMDELHKNGQSAFPVLESTKKNSAVIGVLYLKDLLNSPGKTDVGNIMRSEVSFVPEEQNLWQVLDAFNKTKHHLFIVVNNFEEVVGVISIEDVLEQILGERIVDEFDRYDDLHTVAALQAKTDRQEHTEAK